MSRKQEAKSRIWVVLVPIMGFSSMKDRKRRAFLPRWNFFFWCTLVLFFSGFIFSTTRLFFKDGFYPELDFSWRTPAIRAIPGHVAAIPTISIQETVIFPEQALVFLKYAPSVSMLKKDDIHCVYLSLNSSKIQLWLSPLAIDDEGVHRAIVRCPLLPRGFVVSLAFKPIGNLPAGPTHIWDSLAFEAMIDRDNTTIIFVKGLNLKGGRVSDSSKFRCVYGWDFRNPKFVLQTDVVEVAQEVVRCQTPLSILNNLQGFGKDSIKVSVRGVGGPPLQSIARLERRLDPSPPLRKLHEMCVCTMLRNQAKFLREWVIYHAQIGVQRWFIYDNNSDDDIQDVIDSLMVANHNITRHIWPWIKTQEAGFAHCALRARDSCQWVGFIDVDEFFHFPSGLLLHDVLKNQSTSSELAELRVSCYSFGPSGLKQIPEKGAMVGYTCRMNAPERHKSIVRPEALNSTLINVVHHFHLKTGRNYVNVDRNTLVINHYKYQVWEVFKEKFYRRVATYVSDWQQERNVGSKDRAPGLGTRAVEPANWSSRFCEVKDTGLRDWVLKTFTNPATGLLPWEDISEE